MTSLSPGSRGNQHTLANPPREKLGQIKESYFGAKTPEVAEEISSEEPAKVESISESMSAYVQQLAKRI